MLSKAKYYNELAFNRIFGENKNAFYGNREAAAESIDWVDREIKEAEEYGVERLVEEGQSDRLFAIAAAEQNFLTATRFYR